MSASVALMMAQSGDEDYAIEADMLADSITSLSDPPPPMAEAQGNYDTLPETDTMSIPTPGTGK